MFRENSFARFIPSEGNALYSLWSNSAGEPEDSYVKASNVKGVLHVETAIMKEVIEFPEMIDKLIDKKVTETARALDPIAVKIR